MDDLERHIFDETGGKFGNLYNRSKDSCDEGTRSLRIEQVVPNLPVRIRTAEPQDAALIYDTWLKSYASQNKDQPRWTVYPLHKKIIKRLLRESVTLVAAGNTSESQTDIYSWMCAVRTDNFLVLHFSFTKQMFRNRGLFKSLLEAFEWKTGDPIYCSHRGWIMKSIKDRYNFRYIPHLQFDWGLTEMEKIYEDKAKVNRTT